MDLLQQSAATWNELNNYHYRFTYGRSKKLHTIDLTFPPENYPHLAGFQYLKGSSLPRYAFQKITDQIVSGKLLLSHIQSAPLYETMIRPRLEALIRLKHSLDEDFILYAYNPQSYPFNANIQSDYLLVSDSGTKDFIFIIQKSKESTSDNAFVCCSIFEKSTRDYELNQRPLAILKKERIHIPTNTTTVLFDRLSPNTPINISRK